MGRSICTIQDCPKVVNGYGLCYYHYERVRDGKDPMPEGFSPPWTRCTEEDCERWARSRGLCSKHYSRWLYHDSPKAETRECQVCGRTFTYKPAGKAYKGLYCTRECSNKAKKGGRGRRGPDSPTWKGGRVKWPGGYIGIRVTDMFGQRVYMLEHRHVMEQHLGRSLDPKETVHHKNGVKDDNRLENLELWTGKHGRGVRSHEAEAHCPTCTCFNH